MRKEKFNFWDWEKENELVGWFMGQYSGIGSWKKNVLIFFSEDGETYHSWAYAQLGILLHDIPFKTKLKITYLGIEAPPDHPKWKAKSFKVEVLAPPKQK